ncbi:excinuclease ABC subunit B, partial [Candidatus Nomurabacteria bacterium CG10_big_fil_rev_8_21_14_0_10_35_16]
MNKFVLKSSFSAKGDQPQAINKLSDNIKKGVKDQVLLGVTGSGKTFTMASVIEKLQRPTLVISHNKTLAAQLYEEFKEFFPKDEVHYFVSYYDYYQPEAYIPQSDTYIEKDSKVNEEIDRLRHAATQSLLTHNNTIVVASVSCIYNIGSPDDYLKLSLIFKHKQKITRHQMLLHLTALQYSREDINFHPGSFRVRGEVIEIFPSSGGKIYRIEIDGNQISRITENIYEIGGYLQTATQELPELRVFPAKYWVAPQHKIQQAISNIKQEANEQATIFRKEEKILKAERILQRTSYDMEMLKEVGYCHGIENYSRHLDFRKPGSPPSTLLDYFPKDYLLFIDEAHMSVPQIKGMHNGDQARKKTLVDFGWRLPSALDNRPLKFNEFIKRTGQTVYVSATPAQYEIEKSKPNIVEQLIRPTGLLDPKIEVKPSANQILDLISEIKKRVTKKQRVLVTTITKRLSEDLSEFLSEAGIKSQYLHSEIKTLERPEILKDLREGKYDVLVGINLLREGLDLPEVSLVVILDADKEGFLRNDVTLIQTMGRAARHINGQVIMYADKITASMERAIQETTRRRITQ